MPRACGDWTIYREVSKSTLRQCEAWQVVSPLAQGAKCMTPMHLVDSVATFSNGGSMVRISVGYSARPLNEGCDRQLNVPIKPGRRLAIRVRSTLRMVLADYSSAPPSTSITLPVMNPFSITKRNAAVIRLGGEHADNGRDLLPQKAANSPRLAEFCGFTQN